MTEKCAFPKRPISAAIEKATGVFSRPKLQRRAYTAHTASQLVSTARLSANVAVDLRTSDRSQDDKHHELTEESNYVFITISPCLTTSSDNGEFLGNCLPNGAVAVDQDSISNNDSEIKLVSKPTVRNDKLNGDFSIQCLKVKEIIKEILNAQLMDIEYNHRECGEKGRVISQLIEKRVKALCSASYKVMVLVYIGATLDRGIDLACQCSWSPQVDVFAMESFTTENLFASVVVFATLYDELFNA
ncbi:uncharacterized protein LOC110244355 [Exaiptasia diaphana]|uniref:Uncharacterized protein n=1 Tax=Exaiptasia diaphana TaxID=2652724 RepID=A0A913XLX2_EXADI|nr:uncharacterized protein LOC110244355 [Exaiptasia diaphana]